MLINLRVESMDNFFEILLHGRFLFLLFVSFSGCYLFIWEREERKTISERGRWRGRSRFPASGSLPWDLDHDLSLRQKLKWLSHPDATFSFFFFFFNNKFTFYWCSICPHTEQHTVLSLSVPVIHSPPPPLPSPSITPSSFPRDRSLYVLSPFLIFPTHFFSVPLYSLSLLFIFPKWMRTCNVCPSLIDLLHSEWYLPVPSTLNQMVAICLF